jgi:hypothetical protein
VVQFVEDIEGLLPGVPCFLLFPGTVTDVAEVSEDLGLLVVVAELPEYGDGTVMTVGSLGKVAELVL